MRITRLFAIGTALAMLAGNWGSWAQQSVHESFETVPTWAQLCPVAGQVMINPSNPTGGPVSDPIYGNSVLEISVGPPNILFYCGPSDSYTNFDAEIRARKSAGPAGNPNLAVVYGIVFRAQGPVFYWFAVSTAGYYGLFKFPAPGPRPMGTLSRPGVQIIPWTWDLDVQQGNSWNTLRVEVRGQAAKLFINNLRVEKQTALLLADGPASGNVALGIGTFELFPWAGVTVNFDYLTIIPQP